MNNEELYKLKDLDLELDLNTICNNILETDFRTKSNMLLQTIINKVQQENKQLEDRINKAIEYIEYKEFDNFVVAVGWDNGCPDEACEELLKILKGDSDE